MNLELLDEIYNELYAYISLPIHETAFTNGKSIFVMNEDGSDTDGFAEWLIFNYRNTDQKRTIDLFRLPSEDEMNSVLLNALKKSFRSIFDVKIERGQVYLKDIFTNDDYLVSSTLLEADRLVSARLITVDGENAIVGDTFEMDTFYLESVRKYLLDQYNQFVQTNGMMSLTDFLDLNGHLLYKVMTILTQVEEENSDSDELVLYQATYAFNCPMDILYDRLLNLSLPVFSDEDEEPILRVMKEDDIVAEIEITNGQFYVLCNNASHREMMHGVISEILDETIVFLKDDVFSLEDLL